jgi:hypothetical protein
LELGETRFDTLWIEMDLVVGRAGEIVVGASAAANVAVAINPPAAPLLARGSEIPRLSRGISYGFLASVTIKHPALGYRLCASRTGEAIIIWKLSRVLFDERQAQAS